MFSGYGVSAWQVLTADEKIWMGSPSLYLGHILCLFPFLQNGYFVEILPLDCF